MPGGKSRENPTMETISNAPVVLDFDRSVSLPGARALPLHAWEETIRYGCSLRDLAGLEAELDRRGLGFPRLAFLGSGDFHHVSYLLIRRLERLGPLQVVVFDNHPDNMRYPWGIHCGSWVRHVCRLPFVSRVAVVGITSNDIRSRHLLENTLRPLYSGKLAYFCFSPPPRLAGLLGLSSIKKAEGEAGALRRLMEEWVRSDRNPVYLSIDKDVLSPGTVRTNWDQGSLEGESLLSAVEALRPFVAAADVTGEISSYTYRSFWKRLLSRLDGQTPAPPDDLPADQRRQQRLNEKLASLLIS